MRDDSTTLADCKALVEAFIAERDWQPYHRPNQLAMSLCSEAAEVLELFLWRGDETVEAVAKDAERMHLLRDELADVLMNVLSLSNRLDIDLAAALEAKMRRNGEKYPPPLPGS